MQGTKDYFLWMRLAEPCRRQLYGVTCNMGNFVLDQVTSMWNFHIMPGAWNRSLESSMMVVVVVLHLCFCHGFIDFVFEFVQMFLRE
jgi:hypothetical protein